jgi:opacity protein-like surface antigen
MKKFTMTIAILGALSAITLAGPEQYSGKEMKQVAPAPCPEWYSDTEWNVNVWGAYAFSGTDSNRSLIFDADRGIPGTYDLFLAEDHAWGGGADLKYFFRRYFGVGVEGFALAGHSRHAVIDTITGRDFYESADHTIGAALGTFTLRYPFRCSRFSPYLWGGAGGYFGGSNDQVGSANNVERAFHLKDDSRFGGQVGGGLEVRLTRHIGITGDFSWNFLEGPHNNFGMARTGLNFAF